MVATAIHSIAVYLHSLEDKSHSKDEIEDVMSWKDAVRRREFMPGEWETIEPLPPHPTMFYFSEYDNIDDYPNGLADAVGYWAEDRVFGGVVLFDRGESGKEVCDRMPFFLARAQPTSISARTFTCTPVDSTGP